VMQGLDNRIHRHRGRNMILVQIVLKNSTR
jgi:hypothetical protein